LPVDERTRANRVNPVINRMATLCWFRKAKSVDLDKPEREIEEESNQLARQKSKVSSQ
jgi:hypothetical protein